MTKPIARRLEEYTAKRPQEILIVRAEIEGELDEISIFKGYSSSLMRATAFDPDVPVLPLEAKIISIDRLKSPYTPEDPGYIQQGMSANIMLALLDEVGV